MPPVFRSCIMSVRITTNASANVTGSWCNSLVEREVLNLDKATMRCLCHGYDWIVRERLRQQFSLVNPLMAQRSPAKYDAGGRTHGRWLSDVHVMTHLVDKLLQENIKGQHSCKLHAMQEV